MDRSKYNDGRIHFGSSGMEILIERLDYYVIRKKVENKLHKKKLTTNASYKILLCT